MKAIEAKELSKTFRVKRKEKGMYGSIKSVFSPGTEEIRAVDKISLTVEQGEILAFIGPNGAGKSTTIKMLTGILYPDSGSVEVLGIDPSKKRRRLAYEIGTVCGAVADGRCGCFLPGSAALFVRQSDGGENVNVCRPDTNGYSRPVPG